MPVVKAEYMPNEMPDTSRVRQVCSTCGTKAQVVSVAAIMPIVSENIVILISIYIDLSAYIAGKHHSSGASISALGCDLTLALYACESTVSNTADAPAVLGWLMIATST